MEPVRFGKFMLVEQIAAGGMAEIFKAVGVTAGGNPQTIAIKRILPQYSNDEEFVSLLIDEAKLMVFLNHPNIVPIIEFGKVENSYYIAMDYVEGTTLKGLFKRVRDSHQQFTIDMACHMVREIGSGLAYAHRKTDKDGKPLEIVHRDISPANILISYEGDVKIADFGISKAATQGHSTQIGVIRGKTGYMSPEQTRSGDLIDQRSDLYSLGIILWELLTGDRLYVADSVPEALQLIRKSRPSAPSSRRPQVPPALDAIVLKALAPDPGERYQNGEELVDAINEFLGRFAPGGRPVRVTHTDLTGFLRRYFASEMEAVRSAAPIQLDQMITRVEGASGSAAFLPGGEKDVTAPETIAQNPLFELSSPERKILHEGHHTVPSTSTAEPTIPEATTGGLLAAPTAISRMARRLPRRALWIAAPAIAAAALTWGLLARNSGSKRPAPTPATVLAEIRSEPAGAEIFVDGVDRNQTTPATIEVPRGRNVVVELRKPGYRTETRQIRPEGSGMPLRVSLAADKSAAGRMGRVKLLSDPKGARVFQNGKLLKERTPMEIEVPVGGRLKVRLEAKGYVPKDTTIEMTDAETVEKRIILAQVSPEEVPVPKKPTPVLEVGPPPPLGRDKKPVAAVRPAKLSVMTRNPDWATVQIDGKPVFDAPYAGFPVTPGRHRVTVMNEVLGTKPYEITLEFAGGRETRICFDFETRQAGCR